MASQDYTPAPILAQFTILLNKRRIDPILPISRCECILQAFDAYKNRTASKAEIKQELNQLADIVASWGELPITD
jgi:hypothetical protein